jgi:hypothetical protein
MIWQCRLAQLRLHAAQSVNIGARRGYVDVSLTVPFCNTATVLPEFP